MKADPDELRIAGLAATLFGIFLGCFLEASFQIVNKDKNSIPVAIMLCVAVLICSLGFLIFAEGK